MRSASLIVGRGGSGFAATRAEVPNAFRAWREYEVIAARGDRIAVRRSIAGAWSLHEKVLLGKLWIWSSDRCACRSRIDRNRFCELQE